MSDQRFVNLLALLFIAFWIAMAIRPLYREDWALENALVLAFGAWFLIRRRAIRVSKFHAGLVFIFLCVHVLAAHYTYSEVPYEAWVRQAFGLGVGESTAPARNQFDRLAHFLYGLLLTPLLAATLEPAIPASPRLRRIASVAFIAMASMLYEILEWRVAEIYGGDLGAAWLGHQGDPWDAQKDMGLALLGAVLAVLAGAIAEGWRRARSPASVPANNDEAAVSRKLVPPR